MTKKICTFLALSLVLLFSCNQEKDLSYYQKRLYKDSLYTKYYPDKQIDYTGVMKNGKRNGLWFFFRKDGSLESVVEYDEDGSITNNSYHLKGNQIKKIQKFKKGKRNGLERNYHGCGYLEVVFNYNDDKTEGLAYQYDRCGGVIGLGVYKNGIFLKEVYTDTTLNVGGAVGYGICCDEMKEIIKNKIKLE